MRSLSEILSPDAIDLDLLAADEESAILSLAGLLDKNPDVLDLQKFCEEVFAREKVSPTAAGDGVAFPHARSDALQQIVIAIGRSKAGISFAKSADKIHFVVLIGAPREMVREYLNVVGFLARRLKDTNVREKLMAAATATDFVKGLGSNA